MTTTQVVKMYNRPILCQGEFSASPRSTSVLIALSRNQLSLQHQCKFTLRLCQSKHFCLKSAALCHLLLHSRNWEFCRHTQFVCRRHLREWQASTFNHQAWFMLRLRPLETTTVHQRRKALSEHRFDFYRWLVLQRQQLLLPPLNWSWYHGTFLMDFLSPSKASFTTLQSTAITCVSDSCHTCASKSSNTPSPTSHQVIHMKL